MITKLPRDILNGVLEYVQAETILELSFANKYLYSLTNDEYIWKKKCVDDFNINTDIAYRQKGWKKLYFALINTSVFSWGENFDSRLGLFDDTQSYGYAPASSNRRLSEISTPSEIRSLRGKGIIDIVSGGWSFHALDRYGHIWFWGTMQSNLSPRDSIGVERVMGPVRLQTDIKFKSVSSGRSHGIGLAQDGSVWHWSSCRVIQKVDIDWPVIQATANWENSTVLLEGGRIAVVPLPSNIIHSKRNEIPQPTLTFPPLTSREILGNTEDTIVQLAGLEHHTLALTKFGSVLMLRTCDDLFNSVPDQYVDTLRNFGATQKEVNDRTGKMKRFITGAFRSFAVYTNDGTVLIGSTERGPNTEPIRYDQLNNNNVCKVSFGDYHQGALTSEGKLMTWGNYSSGALGHGPVRSREDSPRHVAHLNNKFVVAIGFGGWQSSAVVIDLK